MAVVLLDPRFPAMIPVEAAKLLQGDVAYTEEVPIRVRWVIADLGGHVVDEADVLVTTDIANELVHERLDGGEDIIKAPSLLVELEGDRELLAGPAGAGGDGRALEAAAPPHTPASASASATASSTTDAGAHTQAGEIQHSGAAVVDGDIVGTDQHTAVVAGLRRTSRTEVPASVVDEMEDAIALMARALRQGEWEKGQTHASLINYLRSETDELDKIVAVAAQFGPGGKPAAAKPAWVEQELCEELADVLLQVLFHAEIANRRGAFDIGHVAGALASKLRSRAPYLFDEVESEVGREEQDRLWEEGKQRERAKRIAKHGESYKKFVETKATTTQPAAAHGGQAQSSEPTPQQPGSEDTTAQPQQVGAGAQQATNAHDRANQDPAQPQRSGMVEADKVIREARQMGLSDMEIPTDIRYPMVGLELDKPGQAEQRLLDAVASFRQQLDQRR